MKSSIILMEFKTGWKGILILSIIIVLSSWGFPRFYPSIKDSSVEELQGAEYLKIEIPDEGEMIHLSWDNVSEAVLYKVLEDNKTTVQNKLSGSLRNYSTMDTNLSVPYDFDEKRYYGVYYLIDNSSESYYLGIVSTETGGTALDTLLENPAYEGLAGGRELTSLDIRGFLAFEVFSWWVLLAGLYLVWRAVASVAEDYREKRMDLIFSTPISRKSYILGKFTSHFLVTIFICLIAAVFMAGSVASVGERENVSTEVIFATTLTSIPLLLCLQVIGILGAVHFKNTRAGMGVAFLFIFAQYALNIIAHVSDSLQSAKYVTVMYYWDYTGILLGEGINFGHFFLLSMLTIIILILSIWTFERQDIPA